MADSLQQWRKRNHLTQMDAAALLGVSQSYLSLIERGTRPFTKTLRSRMNASQRRHHHSTNEHFREQLSALGYSPFAHVPPSRVKPRPDAFLLSVLSQSDVEPRIVEALPWVVQVYASHMDLPWMVRQAKLNNLQNRMGFLFQTAGIKTPELLMATHELERARLLEESTLCWDTMPTATREWIRKNRAPLAKHWNVVTTLRPEISEHAA